MSPETDADAVATDKQQRYDSQVRELLYLALRTLDDFGRAEILLTKPQAHERPWPAYYISTLNYRTTLAGVFAMLARVGATNAAEGLRLRILNEWGPYSPEGRQITILDHIAEMHERHTLVTVPKLDAPDWEALGGLVVSGPNAVYMERLTASTGMSAAEVQSLVEAFRELQAVRDVVLPL